MTFVTAFAFPGDPEQGLPQRSLGEERSVCISAEILQGDGLELCDVTVEPFRNVSRKRKSL